VIVVWIALAVLIGAMAQRVSGMGFALTAAPVLVLLIGPFDGVLLVNLAGAVSASIVISRVWRRIDWRQFGMLTVPALLAVIPGAYISVLLGGPALQITVGVILVVALTISLLINRAEKTIAQTPAALLSGAASGFMSATAGVGGPGVGVYAVLTRWEHRSFAATIQPFFVSLGVTSFVVKVVLSERGLPDYDWWVWPLIIACTLVGLALGEWVSRFVSVRIARISVIVISYLGGFAAIIDGAIEALS
jgi:uncharacterized membrane protein YfcA